MLVAVHHYIEVEGDSDVRSTLQEMEHLMQKLIEPPVVIELDRLVDKNEYLGIIKEWTDALDGFSGPSGVGDSKDRTRALAMYTKMRKSWFKQLWTALSGVNAFNALGWEALVALGDVYSKEDEVRLVRDALMEKVVIGSGLYAEVKALEEDEEGEGIVHLGKCVDLFAGFIFSINHGDEEEGMTILDEAVTDCRGLVLDKVLAGVFNSRAACRQRAGDADGALQDLDEAIALDPTLATAYKARGTLHRLAEDEEKCVEDLCSVYLLEGLKAQHEVQELELVLKNTSKEEALKIFSKREIRKEMPPRWVLETYFRSFAAEDEERGSIASLVRELEGGEGEGEGLLYRAMVNRWTKKYQEAFDLLEKAVNAEFAGAEHKAMAMNQYGTFLYLMGDLEEGLKYLKLSTDCDATQTNSLVKYGGILCEMGETERGLELFEQAVAVAPQDSDIYLHRGQVHLLEDDVISAVNDLRRSISLCNWVPVAYGCLSTAMFKMEENIPSSLRILEDALQRFPDNVEVLTYYGDLCTQKGDLIEALSSFEKAAGKDPVYPLPYINAARTYMAARDIPAAERHLQKALSLDPSCSACYLDLGHLYLQAGDMKRAYTNFDQAIHFAKAMPEVQDAVVFRKLAALQEGEGEFGLNS